MSNATFARPDLTTFTRLDELGLELVGQRLEPDRAVLACRAVEPDQWCRRCSCEGLPRDTVVRRLAHEPFGCRHVWRQDTSYNLSNCIARSLLDTGGFGPPTTP